MASTVERIASIEQAIPRRSRAISTRSSLPPRARRAEIARAACAGPSSPALDWSGAGLRSRRGRPPGDDRLGITGCFCAIAETGTLVFTSGADTPTATTLLPDTHVAVVRARAHRVRHGGGVRAVARASAARMPRAVNLISGPSRTGDIEQTIVLGAHGPFRVHVLVLG